MRPTLVRLHEIAETSSGGTPSRGVKSFYNGEIPWIKSGELPDGEITTVEEKITQLGLESSSAKLVPQGTLVIAMYGATVGRLGILTFPATTNQAVCAIVPSAVLDRDYLFHWLLSIRTSLIATSFGGAQPNISQTVIRDLEVPLYPIERQRQIATHLKVQLAEVETARQAVKIQSQEAAALKSKALEALFADIRNWEPIGSAAKLQSGFAFKSDTFKTAGVRLLRNANILPGRVYWDDAVCLSEEDSKKHQSYVLKDGDVLISLDRPIISSGIKVARVGSDDLPALLVQRVGRFLIDPYKLDANYLYACLQTDIFISEISGHDQSLGVPHISPSQVESVEIPLPDVAVQRELSKRVNEVTSLWQTAAAAIQVQLNDLSRLPKAILAEAFNQ